MVSVLIRSARATAAGGALALRAGIGVAAALAVSLGSPSALAQYATPAPATITPNLSATPVTSAAATTPGRPASPLTPPTAAATATVASTPTPQWLTATPRPTLTPPPPDFFWLGAPVAAATPQPSPTGSTLLGRVVVPDKTAGPAEAFAMPFFGDGLPATPTPIVRDVPTLTTPLAATGETQAVLSIPGRMWISGPIGAPDDQGAVRGSAVGRTVPPPPPIRYAGVPTSSAEAGWLGPGRLWLGIPHRSQFDGTFYAETNCGPASLAMILEAYGLRYPADAIRGEVNRFQGSASPDEGTSLGAISLVAQRAGLHPVGLNRRWTIDQLRTNLTQGQPIITLVRFADLPGNGGADPGTNHYIVLSGMSGDQFIYNDSAYVQGSGRALLISPEVLQRAWANSVISGQAVAFSLNASGAGLLAPGRLSPPFDEAAFAEEIVDSAAEFATLMALAPVGRGASQLLDPRDLDRSIPALTRLGSSGHDTSVHASSIASTVSWATVGVGLLLVLVSSTVLMSEARRRSIH